MNELQKRSILFSLLDVHARLAELESIIDQAVIQSPLSRYENDLSLGETAAVHAHFGRIRAAMVEQLSQTGVPLEVPRVGARWALRCGLMALDNPLAELGPDRLLGYGDLDVPDRLLAGTIRYELGRLIGRAAAVLDGPGDRATDPQRGGQAIVEKGAVTGGRGR